MQAEFLVVKFLAEFWVLCDYVMLLVNYVQYHKPSATEKTSLILAADA